MVKTEKEEIKDIKKRLVVIESFIEDGGLSKAGKLVHCYHINKRTNKPCGKSWVTTSKADLVSCPRCGNKVRINL